MSRITAVESLSLDGVMQAPGRADEDERGGFSQGGWAVPFNDEVMGQKMAMGMADSGALLLGRRTYQDLYGFWPKQRDNPYTDVLDNTTKYVASSTLTGSLPWQNSVLLSGDIVSEVKALKERPGKDIVVLGSGSLMRSLVPAGLVDQLTLMIRPIVLGSGRRLFADDAPMSRLRLTDSVTTTTGVIIATYRPEGSDDA